MSETSLRDRSRARRRAAIEHAALRLFAERGYDATTLAQVAEEAEVAPRTVSMYFPSKLHLALSHYTEAAERLAATLERRDPSSPAVGVIVGWLAQEFDERAEGLELSAAMFRTNPEIRGAETPELTAAMGAITAALAADLGRGADDVVVGLAGGACKGMIDILLQVGPTRAGESSAFDAATRMLDAVMRAAAPPRR